MRSGKNKWRCLVGLTGGMGSGKSTVLAMLKKRGAFTLDADAIVHDLLKNDRGVLKRIRKEFGADVFDATHRLNRKKLASEVFKTSVRKRVLEKILHPRVRQTILDELRCHRGHIAVVDVPLLYESGWQNRFDKVIVVNASLKKCARRLQHKGFQLPDIRRRMKAQWDLGKKVRRADFVVNNNGLKIQTKKQIDQIWNEIAGRH